MRRRRATAIAATAAALLALLAVVLPASPARAAGDLSFSGSPGMSPIVADLAYFYRRSVARPPLITIVGGGTQTGIGDVTRGIVSIGMIDRDRMPEDAAGLVFTPVARSAICMVTNPANRLPDVTRATIQDIAAGRRTTWEQVPGATVSGPIVLYREQRTSGTRLQFVSTFIDPQTPIAITPAAEFLNPSDVRIAVLGDRTGVAFLSLFQSAGLNRVRYDGVDCRRARVADGKYAGVRTYHLVTKGRPKGDAARFIRWVRTSPRARALIARVAIAIR